MAGQQAGQGVYSNALQGLETQQKLAEFKRQQEQRAAREAAISKLPADQQQMYRAYGEAAIPYILKKPERKTEKLNNQIIDVTGDEAKVLFTGVPDEKIGASTTLNKLITERAALAQKNSNDPNLKFYDDAIRKETTKSEGINVTYGAPVVGVNAQGESVFFQPDKGGGAPAIIPGVAPSPQKIGEATQKQLTGIDSLQNSIQSYKNELKGWKTTDALNPAKRAKMGTVYNNMMLQAKEAYGLGVLNGPDYTILTDVIADPSSPKGVAYGAMEALESQADALDNLMTNMKQSIKQAQPGAKQIIPKGEPMPTARRKFNPATGRIE